MLNIFKKFLEKCKCNHEYHKIDSYMRSYVNDYGRIVRYERYVLYCPVCDKEKHVDADTYDRELQKQRVRRNYKGNR